MERRKFLRNVAGGSIIGTASLSGISTASSGSTKVVVSPMNYSEGNDIKYYIGTIGTDVSRNAVEPNDDITYHYRNDGWDTTEIWGDMKGQKDEYILGPDTKVAKLKAKTIAAGSSQFDWSQVKFDFIGGVDEGGQDVRIEVTANGNHPNNGYSFCAQSTDDVTRGNSTCYNEIDDDILPGSECATGYIHGDSYGGGCDGYQLKSDFSYVTMGPYVDNQVVFTWYIPDVSEWLN